MKISLKIALALLGVFIISNSIAQDTSNCGFPMMSWSSKSPTDWVTIQNGNGAAIMVMITVSGSVADHTPGINVRNCGKTTYLTPGSTAICLTNDDKNPIAFSSESALQNVIVSGTYQIKPY